MKQSEWKAGIQLLEQIDPEHDYLPIIREKYDLYRSRLLEIVLRSKNIVKDDSEGKTQDRPKNLEYLLLRKQRSSLYSQRARESNKFHKCTKNSERALVSDTIQEIQNQIRQVTAQINYYIKFGEISSRKTMDDKYPVPSNMLDCHKKINSLDRGIARYKAQIKKLHDMKDANPERKKLHKIEQKFKQLEIHKAIIEKHLREASVQST